MNAQRTLATLALCAWLAAPAAAHAQALLTLELNTNRPGNDITAGGVAKANIGECLNACTGNNACKAFSFTPDKKCFLKSAIPGPVGMTGAFSGLRVAIEITEGTVGGNCNASRAGNYTREIAAECNGKVSCSWKVKKYEKGIDLCTWDFGARYRCGDAVEKVYPGMPGRNGDAWDNPPVVLDCRDRAAAARSETHDIAETWARSPGFDSAPKLTRTVQANLFKDLGAAPYSVKGLEGESFNEITKRLLNFYRKSGSSRAFDLASANAKNTAALAKIAKTAQDQAPDQAKATFTNQAAAAPARTKRESFRRKVEQWTYGYEYEQMAGAIDAKGGNVSGDYRLAEQAALKEFWNDCQDLRMLCEAPTTPAERKACIQCAEDAVFNGCVAGTGAGGVCNGETSLQITPIGGDGGDTYTLTTKTRPNGNSFLNWLSLSVIQEANSKRSRGDMVKTSATLATVTARNIVARLFLPDRADESLDMSPQGKQFLDALPISAWQRCVLWNPAFATKPDVCDKGQTDMDAVKGDKDKINWSDAKLFKLVLGHASVRDALNKVAKWWTDGCTRDAGWCSRASGDAKTEADKLRGTQEPGAFDRDKGMGDAGDGIGNALGPIVGKLLGMLLQAAGMYDMMKTLARAAGMTPEQSADCEDPEYRQTVMKLPKDQDNKGGCLLRVFAKNFTNVLESIIIMLGNKLVDWAVDLVRTLLQPVKSALLAAAGSVPFAGGVLATIVDIAWELLMNFGAKMLLKGFVVAKLPEWLKIRELASLPIDQLKDQPIIAAILGIIMQLIEATASYGDKSLATVGAATVIAGIQSALMAVKPTPDYFWLHALAYAKKELANDNAGTDTPEGAALKIAQALIRGFGGAVSRRLSGSVLTKFNEGIEAIAAALTPSNLSRLTSDPIGTLRDLIARGIGPVAMPMVTSFVNMPDWAKQLLERLGDKFTQTVCDLSTGTSRPAGCTPTTGGLDAAKIIGRVVDVLAPAGKALVGALPVEDSLKTVINSAYDKLVSALGEANIVQLKSPTPATAWAVVKGIVEVAQGTITAKLGDLIQDPRLAPEKTLLTTAVQKIVDVLTNDTLRGQLFGSTVNVNAILSQVADVVKPYASARLRALLAGTGLETLAADASDALFGDTGPFKQASFFTNLDTTLRTQGGAIATRALTAVSGILRAQTDRAPGGAMLGGLVQGLLAAVGKALSTPLTGGAAAILGLVKDAFTPLVDALAPAAGAAANPLSSLLRNVLTGVLNLFGTPASLTAFTTNPASALGTLAGQVATGLKDAVKGLVASALGTLDDSVKTLANQGIDGFFTLLTDPTRLAALRGDGVVDLVKDVGAALFLSVKAKIVTAVGSAITGPASEPVKGLVQAILDEVQRSVGDSARLRALLAGGAKELLATAVRIGMPAVQGLVAALAPAPVKDALRLVIADALTLLGNPTALGALTANDLLSRAAPGLKTLLEAILRTAVPADAVAALQAALTKVQTAIANPAAAAAAALTDARTAIEQTIAGAVVRIPDPGLREVATELVSFASDLVSSDAARNAIKTNVMALLGRLARAGGRYLVSLIPSGPVQLLAQKASEGLQSVFSGTGTLAAALAADITTLLPGVASALGGVARDALQRALTSLPQAAPLLAGAIDELLGLVADKTRWDALKANGLGYLVSRMFPLARDFAMSMLGRLSGDTGAALRPVLQSLLEALAPVFAATPPNTAGITAFATNAVSSLVSMGIGAMKAVVADLVQRATGNADVAAFLRTTLDQLGAALANPTQLQTFLRNTAQQAITALLDPAKTLVGKLVDGAIPDAALKTLAKSGFDAILAAVNRVVGGANIGDAVKDLVAALVPAVSTFGKAKLLELLPAAAAGAAAGPLDALRQLISGAFDKIATFGAQLVRTGQAAWTTMVGGGRVFGDIIGAILPLVKAPIERSVGWAPLRGLLTALVDQVGEMLKDPAALTTAFATGRAALVFLLPKLEKILTPFAKSALVDRLEGLAKDVLGGVVDGASGLLKGPEPRLLTYLGASDAKQVVKCVIDDLKPKLFGGLPDALKTIVQSGIDLILQQVIGAVTCPSVAPAR